MPGEASVEARSPNRICPADPGKVGKYLVRVSITESKPQVALVAYAAVGLNGNSVVPQDGCRATEMRKLLIGPASPTEARFGFANSTTKSPKEHTTVACYLHHNNFS